MDGKNEENYRQARIERLLKELNYEITRGMMDKEVPEEMGYEFYVPISHAIPDGVVHCSFRTRPISRYMMSMDYMEPRLKLIK